MSDFVNLWTVACQAPLSMGFSRQEYWSGLPCCPPRDLPNPWIELVSLTSLALAGGFFTTSATWEAVLPYVSVPHRPTKKKELLSTSPYTDAFQDIRVEKPLELKRNLKKSL